MILAKWIERHALFDLVMPFIQIRYHRLQIYRGKIYHCIWHGPTHKRYPYVALMRELWGVFIETIMTTWCRECIIYTKYMQSPLGDVEGLQPITVCRHSRVTPCQARDIYYLSARTSFLFHNTTVGKGLVKCCWLHVILRNTFFIMRMPPR